ncbi:hypothetical protein KHA94_16985 [Bacillus sp. FJAT-49705]|uniref:Uncharacterized protein n=1 Tax=Cytobacillus citreus TaxID=2833586 RepID=A0ABS5NWQ9_9BACI|nr:hypothetical protein [Cytobacillus citreus]MBS4191864.1 hypothetical protein [Cytobacillus citreus]
MPARQKKTIFYVLNANSFYQTKPKAGLSFLRYPIIMNLLESSFVKFHLGFVCQVGFELLLSALKFLLTGNYLTYVVKKREQLLLSKIY